MSELKPCPFCGRTDTLHFDRYQSNGEWWGYIECTECIMTGPVGKLKKDVVEAWNRRAKDEQASRMDDLISKLSEIRSEYNCFDEDEEQQYRALSETIKILSQLRKL